MSLCYFEYELTHTYINIYNLQFIFLCNVISLFLYVFCFLFFFPNFERSYTLRIYFAISFPVCDFQFYSALTFFNIQCLGYCICLNVLIFSFFVKHLRAWIIAHIPHSWSIHSYILSCGFILKLKSWMHLNYITWHLNIRTRSNFNFLRMTLWLFQSHLCKTPSFLC